MASEAWTPCACGEFWCRIHEKHAFECDCPPIEEWECDPYTTGGPDDDAEVTTDVSP